MKVFKQLTFAIFFLAASLITFSCGNESSKKEVIETIDQSGPEYTSAYVCPMHCEGSGSDAPGKCPVCNMDYVENKEADHGNHEGHNH